MRILITGGRSPYTLELIRLLGESKHEIISVEFLSEYISKHSKYISKRYMITAPNNNFSNFSKELLTIIKSDSIDLVIPTCEEIFHISKLKTEIEQYCKLYCEDISILERLHSKFTFMEDLKSIGLSHPKTFILSDYKEELKGKKIVLKKDYSRFASNIHIIPESELRSLGLSETDQWVLQEFIKGREFSVYTLINDGKLCAYSCYFKDFSINGGATVLFSHNGDEKIMKWIQDFIKKYPKKLTGQFSFDLILSENNEIYPIECNPRPTSGIHLFSENLEIAEAFFNPTKLLVPKNGKTRMITAAMLIYGFSFKNAKAWLYHLLTATDVVWSLRDPIPYLLQGLPLLSLTKISLKKKIKLIEASTIDIEYNK